VSSSGDQVSLKPDKGQQLNLSLAQKDVSTGSISVAVGDKDTQTAANRLMGRMKTLQKEDPDAAGWQSSWSATPLFLNFFALFMGFLYNRGVLRAPW